jgi:hypothetical protein
MKQEMPQRPTREIDCRLEQLVGEPIRVKAAEFLPLRDDSAGERLWIPADNLMLHDGTKTAGPPVFFEGGLRGFHRQIGGPSTTRSIELAR